MPFNRANSARVLSRAANSGEQSVNPNQESANPSQQSVECLAHFIVEHFKQNKISDRQFAILDRARFDRLQKNKAKDKARPAAARVELYDNRPQSLLQRRNFLLIDLVTNRKNGEDLVSDLEYLLEQESDQEGRGSQKFLKLVNKLGFNLEFYTSFRKRAIANLMERARDRARKKAELLGLDEEPDNQVPTQTEVDAEIAQMLAILKINPNDVDNAAYAEPARELLANSGYQSNDPNRPVLKLFFEDDGNVSFEYPVVPRAPVPPVAPLPAVAPAAASPVGRAPEDPQNPVAIHNKRIQEKNAANALVRKRRADVNAPDARTDAASEKNYISNADIFGKYYDTPRIERPGQPVQAAKPTFMQSLGNLLGIFGAFLAKFFEMLMGAKKQSDVVLKNANPNRPLGNEELGEHNADLFEEYRTKLPDENTRNRLVVAWREAKTSEERARVITSLKDELNDARLNEELQTLDFKLCVRNLTDSAAHLGTPGADGKKAQLDKTHLFSLWRQGPAKRKEALHTLHDYMAAKGLYLEMDESLKSLEYMTKDTGMLTHLAMQPARQTYANLLNDLNSVPLHEADNGYRKNNYEVRQALLKAIGDCENKLSKDNAEYEKTAAELKNAQSTLSQCQERERTLREVGLKLNAEGAQPNDPRRQKLAREYREANQTLGLAQANFTAARNAVTAAEKRRTDNLQAEAPALNKALSDIGTRINNQLKPKDEVARIKANRAKMAADHQRHRGRGDASLQLKERFDALNNGRNNVNPVVAPSALAARGLKDRDYRNLSPALDIALPIGAGAARVHRRPPAPAHSGPAGPGPRPAPNPIPGPAPAPAQRAPGMGAGP